MQPIDSPAPIPQSQRIIDLDVLRGFALFGILVVNLQIFAHPMFTLITETGSYQEWYNQAAEFIIHVFFEGKFITLFSFLFGIGFYIFVRRLKLKKLSYLPVFSRRMVLLFIIGYLHAWLLWAGDILAPYAIGGLLLMLFLNRSDKTIKIWIGVFIGGFTLFFTVLVLMIMFAMTIPDVAENLNEEFTQQGIEYELLAQRGYDVHQTGSFSEIMSYRSEERGFVWLGMFFSPAGLPYIIAIFLFGLLIGRKGILDNPQAFREYFIRNRNRNILIGLPCSILFAFTYYHIDPIMIDSWYILHIISFYVGTPLLCFGYVGYILMLLQKNNKNSLLPKFAPVGRMALTNYLMQSVICTTLFSGYALGFYGKLTPLMVLPVAVIIFALQVWFSIWYFKRFKMGPMEKLWRIGTYLKRI